MEIKVTTEDAKAIVAPEGKLTVATAPELEATIGTLGEDVKSLDVDLAGVDYVASAGLRVLVAAQKLMSSRSGAMTILHPSDDVYDVFEMTGLAEILTIER